MEPTTSKRAVLVLAVALVAQAAAALPPGFPTPITAAGNDLSLWGRKYGFDTTCGPFPRAAGVVSSCAVQLDGRTLVWAEPKLVSNDGEAAVLTTSAAQGSFSVAATTTVDLAGIATIDLTVTNTSESAASFAWKAAVTLDGALDVYLRRHVEYDPATFRVGKGETSRNFGSYVNGCFDFVPSWEVGDHARTFEWVLDGDYDWLPADRTGERPLCTSDSAGSPVLSVEAFPGAHPKRLAAKGSWSEKYLVAIHPTRPPLADWRGLQLTNHTQIPGWFRPEKVTGKRFFTLLFPGVQSANGRGRIVQRHSGSHRFVDDEHFRDQIATNRADGIESLPYGSAQRSWYLHPTFLANRADWAIGKAGRDGLDFVGNFDKELSLGSESAPRTLMNVDGDPWTPPWIPPHVSGPAAISAACKGRGDPWKCCTGAGTGKGCSRADMAIGYNSGCDDEQDGNDEYAFRLKEAVSAFQDPRVAADGLYHDFGNISRSCTDDPRRTHASQQVWFYHHLLWYYEGLYRAMQANGGARVVPSRPAHPLDLIHTSGHPRMLAGWTDVLAFGETLGEEFGTIGSGGCKKSGCADGACNDGTEACVAYGSTPSCNQPNEVGPGCGFCPDYVGLGEDTLVAITKPNSGGITSSILAMQYGECVDNADSASYWVRNFFTAFYGVGLTLGAASQFADKDDGVPFAIQRQHHSILDDFGSVLDEDVRVTYAHENSPAYSTAGGVRVSLYAHPSLTGCVAECSKKALFIVQNWTNADIADASLTIHDHEALGLTEGGKPVNCVRVWDPSRVSDGTSSYKAAFGPWRSDTSPFAGLDVAAKSYVVVEAKQAASCR
jgi:hypothetical protein